MEIEVIHMVYGLMAVLFGVLWWRSMEKLTGEIQESRRRSDAKLPEIVASLSQFFPEPGDFSPKIDDLKEDFAEIIEEVLEDAMSNVQMPTAQDHIFGAIANIIQHKMIASAPPIVQEMLPTLNEGDIQSTTNAEEI